MRACDASKICVNFTHTHKLTPSVFCCVRAILAHKTHISRVVPVERRGGEDAHRIGCVRTMTTTTVGKCDRWEYL